MAHARNFFSRERIAVASARLSPPSHPTPRARVRTPGFDVARAFAVLGMLLVNFRGKIESEHDAIAWLTWLSDRMEGKAGALFVLLAGIGISLKMHDVQDFERVRLERRALLERAAILFAAGLVLMHVWDWDILHFYGVYMLLAVPLLWSPARTLWGLAAGTVLVGTLLNWRFEADPDPTLTTLHGGLRHVFFDGLYPVFPWLAFLLVGMAVGRMNLDDTRTRRRLLVVTLAIGLTLEGVDALARWDADTGALGWGWVADWLRTWPRAPRPLFVVSCSAFSIAAVCACIELTRAYGDRRAVVALVATGQLALTIYVAHVLAIVLPLQHGVLDGMPLWVAYVYAFAFYAVAIPCALWWRRRWRHGPFEGVLRQVARREDPGPWEAVRLRD